MQELKKEEITRKLDLVVNKLLTLGGPENETELENGGESIGFFRRDFGISEWDWPQGVGLYGLYKIMMVEKKDEYRKFLCSWFKSNMAEFKLGRLADALPPPHGGRRLPARDQRQRRPPGRPFK